MPEAKLFTLEDEEEFSGLDEDEQETDGENEETEEDDWSENVE